MRADNNNNDGIIYKILIHLGLHINFTSWGWTCLVYDYRRHR